MQRYSPGSYWFQQAMLWVDLNSHTEDKVIVFYCVLTKSSAAVWLLTGCHESLYVGQIWLILHLITLFWICSWKRLNLIAEQNESERRSQKQKGYLSVPGPLVWKKTKFLRNIWVELLSLFFSKMIMALRKAMAWEWWLEPAGEYVETFPGTCTTD